MSVDVLDYMIPNPQFMASWHVESPENPIYCYPQVYDENSGVLWYIKNAQGYPWDGNYYNANLVLQSVTEIDSTPTNPNGSWTDPTLYKKFTNQALVGGNVSGIGWSPRHIQTQAIPFPQYLTTDSTYDSMQNATVLSTSDLGGPTICQIQGPFDLQVGALGFLPTLVQTYLWGPSSTPTMEVNWYALGFGWVRWQEYLVTNSSSTPLTNGQYQLNRDELFDSVVAGGTPTLVWPNPLP
jgi:hypothetical protein